MKWSGKVVVNSDLDALNDRYHGAGLPSGRKLLVLAALFVLVVWGI